MASRNWKKILLQWISECNFMEHNYLNIEQTDIELFFQKFCRHMNILGKDVASATGCANIAEFLHEYYPAFQPNFDDDYALNSSDYIFVYSLMLHFSCVKYPEEFFHRVCQKLSDQSQQGIATFFKQLLDCSTITKDTLRNAISDTTQLSPPSNASFASSANSLQTASLIRFESPIKTPVRFASKVSPPTPKTSLLEERTRELYNLKAQLETERYEKGLLEVQIKQNEDKIRKLNSDHRKLQQQIQDLKNDILTKSNENNSPNRDLNENQVRRRLCKEISQKEQEISKLTDILSTLREEKNFIQEKLIFAEKQIVVCMNRIKELDYKVDELSADLEQKNGTIRYLTDNKIELERFIAETRTASTNYKADLSTDCFDSSFSRTTNSSGSQGSPENLGCSVIDVQLREKEIENNQLKQELLKIRTDNNNLAKHMQQLAIKHSQDWEINIENVTVSEDDDAIDPTEHFSIFANCVDKLSKLYKDERNTAKKLQHEAQVLEKRTEDLSRRVLLYETEVSELKLCIQNIEVINKDLDKSRTDLQEKLFNCEKDIEMLNKHKNDLVNRLETLKSEYVSHKQTCEAKELDLTNQIANLQRNFEQKSLEIQSYQGSNTQILHDNQELQRKLNELKERFKSKSAEYELEVQSLNERLSSAMRELERHERAELTVKDKYEKLLIQCEDMKRNAREVDDYLEQMRNAMAIKEMQVSKLGNEILEVRSKNALLEERVNTIVNEQKLEKQAAELLLSKKEGSIKELQNEKEKLQGVFESLQAKFEETQKTLLENEKEINKSTEEMQEIVHGIELLKTMLKMPIEKSPVFDSLEEIAGKVKGLLDLNAAAVDQIDCLEDNILEYTSKLQSMEENLQQEVKEKNEMIKRHEEDIIEFKTELSLSEAKIKEYENQLELLNVNQQTFVDDLKDELQNNIEENTELRKKIEEIKAEKERTVSHLNEQRKSEKENHMRLERELIIVIGNHNAIQLRLSEIEAKNAHLLNEKARIQKESKAKITSFEEKLQNISKENNQLRTEINEFKSEHARIEQLLLNANAALTELADKLNEESASKSQLNLQLKHSEVRLLETEKKLQNILQEKSTTINDLQLTYESQLENLKQTVEQVHYLEETKLAQDSQIEELNLKLNDALAENETLSQTNADQMQREQEEKAELLETLEKTADQLKLTIEQSNLLQKSCAELEEKYNEAHNLNCKLQSEFIAKEAEFTLHMDECESERNDMQNKITCLIRKVSEQAEKLEMYELVLMELLGTIENNTEVTAITKLFNNDDKSEWPNIFNATDEEDGTGTQLNQLKVFMNKLMLHIKQLQTKVSDIDELHKKAVDLTEELKKSNTKLTNQVKFNKAEIAELQEMLAGEAKSLETKLANEVQRLNDDLQNIENVNEKLTGENGTLQFKVACYEEEIANIKIDLKVLNEEKSKLLETQKTNLKSIEDMKQEQNKTNEQLKESQAISENLKSKCISYEAEIKEKSLKLVSFETELQEAREDINKLQSRLQKLQNEFNANEQKTKELNDKCRNLLEANAAIEYDFSSKSKEFIGLQAKISELSTVRRNLEEQFRTVSSRLDECIEMKLESENKYETLNSHMQQLQRDYKFCNSQYKSSLNDIEKLSEEIKELKADKLALNNELKESKREVQRANDNVSQLIQQIASIRLEKDGILEENQLLRKQQETSSKYQTTSESKLKSIIERSQALELSLLTSENDVKSIKSNMEKNGKHTEKLASDNQKLRETQEASTKRIEKLALKLGDSQARCSKLERENEKLSKTIEANNATIEALQREKDQLHVENKSIKELLSRFERTNEQLSTKFQTLEQTMAALQEDKQKLEVAELDGKSKLTKLEKMRETYEEKIRKLNLTVNNFEQSNVRLNLEIGALNSQLNEEKRITISKTDQLEETQKDLIDTQEKVKHYEELSTKLKTEVEDLRQENILIADKLSKISLSLHITEDKCEALTSEMQTSRSDIETFRDAKEQLEIQHDSTVSNFESYKSRNDILVALKQNLITELEEKVGNLEAEILSKSTQLDKLQLEVEELRSKNSEKLKAIELSNLQAAEIDEIRSQLSVTEALLEKEQSVTAQLRMDNQVLQAKYKEAKERLDEESKSSENRIKENRLELEGKLDKMKNKMKTLYTEEITKMKVKQERETASIKSELEVVKAQNVKYEEHTRKLSNQIVRLNDKILEYKKQNTILATKLKHLEEYESQQQFKRPSSIHVSTLAATSSNMGTNLAMEDEEGEVFNNTYLADLKNGRVSDIFYKDIAPEELLRRNSQLPPHLKSAYAAQYAHDLAEDDLKEIPPNQNLDDSMSALLSTTAGGTRKKISGATSYKRPGPPTPSKNGGRLSFGGTSEPVREILKETYDSNQAVTSSSKTPARFKTFASRFSLGSVKDEHQSNHINLRKAIHEKNVLQACKTNAGTVCTSTPRKSKEHFDQLRILDEILAASPSNPEPTTAVCIVSSTNDTKTESIVPTPPTAKLLQNPTTIRQRRLFERSRRSSLLKRNLTRRIQKDAAVADDATASGLPSAAKIVDSPLDLVTSGTTSSGGEIISSLHKRLRRRPKRERGTRPSLYLKGNVFSKNRVPTRGLTYRDLIQKKARKQRTEHFNKHRMDVEVKGGERFAAKSDIQNNNYASFNHNQMGKTIIIGKNNSHSVVNFMVQDVENLEETKLYEGDFDDGTVAYDSYNYDQANDLDGSEFEKQQIQKGKRFEEILTTTESYAPFDIQKIEYESTIQQQQSLQNVSSPTSRTFYGSSTIYNRKIPNISTTFVRKSSIYIKKRNGEDDIILLTNQTITLMDLIRMWQQMDSSLRLTLGIAILASLISLVFLLVNMFIT